MTIPAATDAFQAKVPSFSNDIPITEDSSSGDPVHLKSTANAAHTVDQGVRPGDHGEGVGSYHEATPGANYDIISTTGSDVNVSGGVPARLFAIFGANGVVNGSQVVIKDGSTTKETMPAGSIPVAGLDRKGAKFNTSLVLNITAASATSIGVLWGPLLT